MRTISIALLLLVTGGISIFAQTSIDRIVEQVAANNTTLAALRKERDAGRIGNHTGIAMKNPDVEFHYLWGNPTSIGNRTDLYISQSFDFPTAYGWKNRIAGSLDSQLELFYERERKGLMLKVRLLLVNIISTNALQQQYERRLDAAGKLAAASKTKLDRGEGTILEFNKSQLYLLGLVREAGNNTINREALLTELAAFNGGIALELKDTSFIYTPVPVSFEAWYQTVSAQIPELGLLRSEVEISLQQERLNLAMSLPKLSAGYMGEMNSAVQLQGITAGISVPLWENSNRVKFARARTLALQELESDRRLQIANELRMLHTKATRLQQSVNDYRNNIRLYNSTALLDKALEKGEINLFNYLLELSAYHECIDQLIRSERELNMAVMELGRYGG